MPAWAKLALEFPPFHAVPASRRRLNSGNRVWKPDESRRIPAALRPLLFAMLLERPDFMINGGADAWEPNPMHPIHGKTKAEWVGEWVFS